MTNSPIDYSKTVFYKIVCNDLNVKDLYVGHTTNFRIRKARHKDACLNKKSNRHHLKVYQFIRENGDWKNWTMVEIIKQSCSDKQEARAVERGYIETLNAMLNCNIPGRTHEMYLVEKRDEILEQRALYRNENAEMIKENARIYRVKNREQINQNMVIYRLQKKNNNNISHVEPNPSPPVNT
jgi:hypothetical protein